MRAAGAGVLIVVCVTAPIDAWAQDSDRWRRVAERVHDRGGYTSRLRIRGPSDQGWVWIGGDDAERSHPRESGRGRLGRDDPTTDAPRGSTDDDRSPGAAGGCGWSPGGPGRSEPGGEPTPFRIELPFLGPIAEILAKLILYGGLAALVAGFVWLLFQLRPRHAPPTAVAQADEAAAVPIAPDLAGVDPDADVEALIRSGRLEEAVRVLLLRALRSVGWKPLGAGRSKTAREVVAGVPGADPRRSPLASAVLLAEGVRFAGRPATRETVATMSERLFQIESAPRGA